jgi:hypothetical protein
MWDPGQRRLLTVENLDYFLRRSNQFAAAQTKSSGQDALAQFQEEVMGKRYILRNSSLYGRPSEPLTPVTVAHVERIGPYVPAIRLMAEPGLCLALLPAQQALSLAHKIKQKYECELGRVRDRLPLYLGIVFAPRRTPLYAIINAGRRLLGMGCDWQWEEWEVVANEQDSELAETGIQRVTFSHGVTWRVPVTVGAGARVDEAYPNWLTTKPSEVTAELFRESVVKNHLHVSHLLPHTPDAPAEPKARVFVRPSRFDFEFLDASGRRFGIRYNAETRRTTRTTRPFRLEDLDRLATIWDDIRHLARSQRVQVVQSIEAVRESWFPGPEHAKAQADPVFRQFVHDTLAGAAWSHPYTWHKMQPARQTQLIDAAVSGELVDLLELYMQILQVPDSSDVTPTLKG